MLNTPKFYVTTPIYYGNGIPHIGHFYSSTIANVIYKFYKISGYNARFTTGIDENSQKAVLKAEEEGIPIMDYLDKMSDLHKGVWEHFNLDYTDFIRTTEDRHKILVQKVLQHCFDKGDIYEGEYEGMYCVGCESFKKDDDLILLDGENVCPDHLKKPDYIKEKNYFFKLKKYQKWVEEFYTHNPHFVEPQFRFNEVIAFVGRGLEDFSISRETNTFGIPLPFDSSQVTYVWFDALFNYYTSCISSRGGDKNNENFLEEQDFWENNPQKLHVVGKDIIRFHAIFWPAMLASYFDLGEEKNGDVHYLKSDNDYLPTQILTGGYFTVDGQKMSKTIGNVIEPVAYSEKYSKELMILYMLSSFPIGNDGDYDKQDAILTYNAKMANNFGNLLNRVVVLGGKSGGRLGGTLDTTVEKTLVEYSKEFDDYIGKYFLKNSLDASFVFLDYLNKYTDIQAPWKLLQGDTDKAEEVLYTIAEGLRIVGLNLYSFFPEKMGEMFTRLGLVNYVKELEQGKLKELRLKKEVFEIVQQEGVLFEKFELLEDTTQASVKESIAKKINFSIDTPVTDLGLHVASVIIEVPKVINRRNGGLKKYIKEVLDNIDFNDPQRVALLSESESFYKKNNVENAMHPSVYLQKMVENSGKLPNINNVVDCYNIESLQSGLSIGVHDIEKIEGDDVFITLASGKETFIPLGGKEIIHIGEGEYACTDSHGERIICRMDCKQGVATLISKETKKIFIYVQGNSACNTEYLEKTLAKVSQNIVDYCGGNIIS